MKNALDGVTFVDPRRSQVDIVQAVGRAIRKAENKKVGTIVLPVFIEDPDDSETTLNASAFEPVWAVLKALRGHDQALAEELDSIRRAMGRYGGRLRVPGKVRWNLPASIGVDFVKAFRARLIERSTASWEFWFGLLLNYAEREGHAVVPTRHVERGFNLGKWVSGQRNLHAKGALDDQRVHSLQALPGWSWKPFSDYWLKGFQVYQDFVTRWPDRTLPDSVGGFPLRTWTFRQRARFRRGKLKAEQVRMIESIRGWVWDAQEAEWERGVAALSAYVARTGHSRVPVKEVVNGFPLGAWVQRKRWQHRRDLLPRDRAQRLQDQPGWTWDEKADSWKGWFELLSTYVARENHALVPHGHVEAGQKLGEWASNQRRAFELGRLERERIERLEALPGWSWNLKETISEQKWMKAFELLRRFAQREGHANVPQTHRENRFGLGTWVGQQRVAFSKGTLPDGRRARLEEVAGWEWDAREAWWEEAFGYLMRFVQRESHSRVPAQHVEGDFKLGGWVRSQRAYRDGGTLSSERISRLEELPAWTWDPSSDDFEVGYSHLLAYSQREGHARVPAKQVEDGYALGKWAARQRRAHRDDKLPKERVKRLASLPDWSFDVRDTWWAEGYSRLQQFVAREGHSRVPPLHMEDGFKLSQWTTVQRTSYKQGKLSPDRISKLERTPGWAWVLLEARWAEGYATLQRFVAREGHSRVLAKHLEDGYKLGQWVTLQRASYRQGKLGADRVSQLERTAGWVWDGREKST